jgi:TatD DNase family protein
MPLRYFDAHTHVQFPAFDADRDAVMARALNASVGVINAGSTTSTSARAVEFANTYPNAWATIGIHPGHAGPAFHDADELGLGESDEAKRVAAEGEVFDVGRFTELASDPKVVGIGECGLDYYRLEGDVETMKEKQKKLFLMHIVFAHEVKKPLVIHCREAMADLIALLHESRSLLGPQSAGIVHFFTGSVDDARELLELGFSFTFGGVVTYPRKPGKPNYDEVVRFLPADRVLSETDAPDVAPVPYRGKRSEPAFVVEVVKKLAEIRGESVDMMAAQLLANVSRIFGIN